MLTPIPRRILRDAVTFYVPASFDEYQAAQGEKPVTVNNVCVQADNSTKRTNTAASGFNTEVTLKGLIFIDARYSRPLPDLEALQTQTQAAGGVLTCTVKNRHGGASGPFTVVTVDALQDDEGNLHHYEIGVT